MASRDCEACCRRFGTGIADTARCVFCGGTLNYNSGAEPTVTKEEYDTQLYASGKKVPKSLPADELIRLEREWADLELEAARRGPSWSLCDLIGEGFRPGDVAHS